MCVIQSRMALGPTQSPIHWVPGALSLGVKRPGREADHSSPSSAEVKNAWTYTPTLTIRLHGVVFGLKKYRDNFTFLWSASFHSCTRSASSLFMPQSVDAESTDDVIRILSSFTHR
jgi:hypothetical protein